jgi:urease accessory protein UreF
MSYTVEQEDVLREGAEKGREASEMATELGKSLASVVAKLAQMGLYKAKTRAKSDRVTKADMVAMVAEKLGVAASVLKSLEKADKIALETLVKSL